MHPLLPNSQFAPKATPHLQRTRRYNNVLDMWQPGPSIPAVTKLITGRKSVHRGCAIIT